MGMGDGAVADVLGNLLMVAITTILMTGLIAVVFSYEGPPDTLHATLGVNWYDGGDGWGDGDEVLRLQHRGGEEIPARGLSVRITIDGSTTSIDAPGSNAFSDGRLVAGETWQGPPMAVAFDDAPDVAVVHQGEASQAIALATVRPASASVAAIADPCEGETTPPGATFEQDPADVTSSTEGPVTVDATVQDGCSGVDAAIDPHLWYRINNGSSFTDLGAMGHVSGTTWTGTIPESVWHLHGGTELQYFTSGMTDNAGNTGNSSVQTDFVDVSGTDTFVDSNTAIEGSVADFSNAQSDGGAEATLAEGSLSTTSTQTIHAQSASGSGATNPDNALGAGDDAWAGIDSNNDQITVTDFDVSAQSDPIQAVEFVIESHYDGLQSDDGVDLEVNLGSGWTTVESDFVPDPQTDSEHRINITSLDPSWTWSDIQDAQLRATYSRNAAPDSFDVQIDSMHMDVTVHGATVYSMQIQLDWAGVPAGVGQFLQLQYRVSGDTFHVEVWDGSSWNSRTTALDAGSSTLWSTELSVAEYNLGSPRIRILDDTTDTTQAQVHLGWAKVVST